MIIGKVKDWAVFPCSTNTCTYKNCVEFLNPKDIYLSSNCINNICTGLRITHLPNHILKVNNHLCNKPWRIVNNFIFSNSTTLHVPVITTKNILLKAYEPLCHMQEISLPDALQLIKSKHNLILLFYYLCKNPCMI